jgi:CPA1 family monovalent cation:H+ antiporter
MPLVELAAIFLALLTAIGWINERFFRLPTSVAMLGAGVISAGVLLGAQLLIEPFWGFNDARAIVGKLDFSRAVLNYLLGFLMFASGLRADLSGLRERRAAVWTLATVGVLISTGLVGFGLWGAARLLGHPIPLAWTLTFGALISPTDPIAVGEALKSGAVSTRLGVILQGEALFNDGVGFVMFTAMAAFAASGDAPHPLWTGLDIVLESGGGLVLGVVLARALGLFMLRTDNHILETTATLALALGVYVLAQAIHVSGPVAASAAGLMVGEYGLKQGMSQATRRVVEGFWELIDEILNALLFLLLGLQVFVLPFSVDEIGLWIAALALAIIARLAVVLPSGAFLRPQERGASLLLTWGGLRGAVSLALALSIPHQPYRGTLLATTFVVVVFSVVVQGLTFAPMARRLQTRPAQGGRAA